MRAGPSERRTLIRPNHVGLGAGVALLISLVGALGEHEYALVHLVIEFASIAIAIIIFTIAWHARRQLKHTFFLYIGLAYIHVAIFDFLHSIAFEGFAVITVFSPFMHVQFWIVARLLQSSSLVIISIALTKQPRFLLVNLIYLAVTSFMILAIVGGAFPGCTDESIEGCPLLFTSELVILFLFGAAFTKIARWKHEIDKKAWWSLLASVAFMIISSLMFAGIFSFHGVARLVGLLTKAFASFCLYVGIVEVGLVRPYALLQVELDLAQEQLVMARILEASRKQASVLIDGLPDPVVLLDTNLSIHMVNETFSWDYGWMKDEVIGRSLDQFILQDNVPRLHDHLASILQDKAIRSIDCTIQTKDGGQKHVSLNMSWIEGAAGESGGLLAVLRDITLRMHLEKQLADNEEMLKDRVEKQTVELERAKKELEVIMDGIPGMVFFKDVEWDNVRVNKHAVDVYHASGNDPIFLRYVDEVIRSKAPVLDVEAEWNTPAGKRWFNSNVIPILDERGEVKHVIGVSVDVSESMRQKAEIEALARFPGENPNPVLRVTPDGTVNYANAPAETILSDWGCGVGLPLPSFLRRAVESSGTDNTKLEVEATAGGKWYALTISPVRSHGYVNIYGRDVTERVESKALLARELEFKTILESMASSFINVADIDDNINNTLKQLGIIFNTDVMFVVLFSDDSVVVSHSWNAAGNEDARQVLEHVLASSVALLREQLLQTIPLQVDLSMDIPAGDATGGTGSMKALPVLAFPLRHQARAHGALCCGRGAGFAGWDEERMTLMRSIANTISAAIDEKRKDDALRKSEKRYRNLVIEVEKLNAELEARVEERTRELKQTQEKLILGEKLAAIGKLSGSIAHELRNPLGTISNALYFLNLKIDASDPKIRKHLDLIKQEVSRSQKIISNLVDFSKSKKLVVSQGSIKQVLDASLATVQVPSVVSVRMSIPSDLPSIEMDADQVQQAFRNLIVNAIDAMPGGGTLDIHASSNGERARVSFKDSGTGIDPLEASMVFEPLYTTKPSGMGFGLPIVKDTVEKHGGSVAFESEPGKGTTFTIEFPVRHRREA